MAERPAVSGSELGRLLGKSERLGRKLKAELLPELGGNGAEPILIGTNGKDGVR